MDDGQSVLLTCSCKALIRWVRLRGSVRDLEMLWLALRLKFEAMALAETESVKRLHTNLHADSISARERLLAKVL